MMHIVIRLRAVHNASARLSAAPGFRLRSQDRFLTNMPRPWYHAPVFCTDRWLGDSPSTVYTNRKTVYSKERSMSVKLILNLHIYRTITLRVRVYMLHCANTKTIFSCIAGVVLQWLSTCSYITDRWSEKKQSNTCYGHLMGCFYAFQITGSFTVCSTFCSGW